MGGQSEVAKKILDETAYRRLGIGGKATKVAGVAKKDWLDWNQLIQLYKDYQTQGRMATEEAIKYPGSKYNAKPPGRFQDWIRDYGNVEPSTMAEFLASLEEVTQ